MKRTLILSAALMAAGVATSMAQVFSVNAVGYVNQTIVPGFNLISNPFKNQTNTLNALLNPFLMPGNGAGVIAYRFNYTAGPTPLGFVVSTVEPTGDGLWLDGNGDLNGDTESLVFGEGVFLFNGTGQSFTVTWVGEVEQGTPITNPIPPGFSIKSSKVPQAGKIQSELGLPGQAGDLLYKWLTAPAPAGQKYATFQQDPGGGGTAGEWLDEDGNLVEPSVGIAESVFYNNLNAARSWDRNFTVN